MKQGENWRCPFCMHFQVLSDKNLRSTSGIIGSEFNKHSVKVGRLLAVECMNADCKEIAVHADIGIPLTLGSIQHPSSLGRSLMTFRLRPCSMAKPQRECVPKPLVADYEEACAILGGSPKASATLARRCLQGMIRDFCGIKKGTLASEIAELQKQVEEEKAPRQVSEESIEAIQAVRKIGNIGAHFEKDINLIIDVTSEEAQCLISLVEILFEEWYVSRHLRQQRLAQINAIAAEKDSMRAAARKAVSDGEECAQA